jgi:hypothetical protein
MMGQFKHCISQRKEDKGNMHMGNQEAKEKTFLCKFVAE